MERNFDNIYSKRFGYFNLHVIKGENGDILIDNEERTAIKLIVEAKQPFFY